RLSLLAVEFSLFGYYYFYSSHQDYQGGGNMKMHRFEKAWLTLADGSRILSISISAYQTLRLGIDTASDTDTIAAEKVDETAQVDNPGVFEIGENEYEVVMTLEIFSFNPDEIEIPVGSTVHFTMTSKDVLHGFQVVGTNLNAMVTPGHIQRAKQTFN